MSIYIQIGAGAGDLDPRAEFKDGFSKFIKSLDRSNISKLLFLEVNSHNIPKLVECWKDYAQAEILNIGLTTKNRNDTEIHFYYALEDQPHYQVASMSLPHVEKHYPAGTIKHFTNKCYDLETVINQYIGANNVIEFLCLDIEGVEYDIILDTDWSKINCNNITFEHLHMTDVRLERVNTHLNNYKFNHVGYGLDHNKSDLHYKKIV